MKHLLRVALISALVATTAHAASASVLAATPANATAPPMELVSTTTGEEFPFAEIAVDQNILHVTEGDKLYGVYVVHITANDVTLSDGRVLHISRATIAATSR